MGLRCSNAARWLACPGSVRLGLQVPQPPQSDAAAEGTAAHALAAAWLEALLAGRTPSLSALDSSLLDAVSAYVDVVEDDMVARGGELRVETPVAPGFGLRGTADAVLLSDRHVTVYDFKAGQGVTVSAEGNPQLKLYLLGFQLIDGFTYEGVIVQPRGRGEPVTRVTYTADELRAFRDEVGAAIKATEAPDAPLIPGEHCAESFCPAASICSAIKPAETLPAVDSLTPEEIATALDLADRVSFWVREVRARAYRYVVSGNAIPGYGLAPARTHRKWRDAGEVARLLADRPEAFEPAAVKSPAQVEKIAGKKFVAEHAFSPAGKLSLTKGASGTGGFTDGDGYDD